MTEYKIKLINQPPSALQPPICVNLKLYDSIIYRHCKILTDYHFLTHGSPLHKTLAYSVAFSNCIRAPRNTLVQLPKLCCSSPFSTSGFSLATWHPDLDYRSIQINHQFLIGSVYYFRTTKSDYLPFLYSFILITSKATDLI